MYVTSQQEFETFLDEANSQEVVAIDTEFLREKTYWPRLCLIQLAINGKTLLVDPFKVDIKPIKKLLANKKIVKLFHSPRQDIEILLHEVGVMPDPVFDTQIAAAFLGHSVQIGYGNLVAAELGIKLKKGDTYTDWSIRPLSKSQLSYAKDDVKFLLELYYVMTKKLNELNRLNWVYEDIKVTYLGKDIYETSFDDRFWHLKRVSTLTRRQLACAKELASWREKMAIKRNIPRRWVVSDEQIVEICKQQPKKIEDLFSMRGAKSSLSTGDARAMVDAVKRGNEYSEDELPSFKDKHKYSYKNEEFKNDEIAAESDLMSALVRHRAKEINIAAQTLAPTSDLNKIAYGVKSGIPTLSGWRKKVIGNELLDLVSGKLTLSLDKGKLMIERNKNV